MDSGRMSFVVVGREVITSTRLGRLVGAGFGREDWYDGIEVWYICVGVFLCYG